MKRRDCDRTADKTPLASVLRPRWGAAIKCGTDNESGYPRGLKPAARAVASRGLKPAARLRRCLPAVLICVAWASTAEAGLVRLWPTAVVVSETVRLDDLCELSGFDRQTAEKVAKLVVAPAPQDGGSSFIHLDMIRSRLETAGVNMANVTMGGAIECTVSRPSRVVLPPEGKAGETSGPTPASPHEPNVPVSANDTSDKESKTTLKQAVIDYFNEELARYAGSADVLFDHTSPQILDLTGPPYEFVVRRRSRGVSLGLVHIEVSVLAGGKTVQTLQMMVNVQMLRRVVVARGPINQGAIVRAKDVRLLPMSFARVDRIGLASEAQIIGQRAKRFMPAGTLIELGELEAVPLVQRGQIVTLASTAGSVRVVTSARAMASGYLGEVISVRDPSNKRMVFDAVITGPGTVQIGNASRELLARAE